MANHATSADDCNVSDSDFVWGAVQIGRVIGRNHRQTSYLLETGQLKAPRKIGGRWMVSKSALLRELAGA